MAKPVLVQSEDHPLRVAGYARVSTTGQANKRDSSVDTQINAIRLKVDYEAAQAREAEGGRSWQLIGEYREEG
jgi:DNA invertase Pin-like site-specific DNA recombinase